MIDKHGNLHSKFSKRAKEEFDKNPQYSAFLDIALIRKYPTAISIPTASNSPTFDIDKNGNLR